MRKQTEGSRAVAEAVAMCRPEVVCAPAVGINSVERFLADEAPARLEGSRPSACQDQAADG